MDEGTGQEDNTVAFEDLIHGISDLVDPGYGTEKIRNREIAIAEFIKDVAKIMEETMPHLKVSEVLLVGGYAEGTKIITANEFDFLIVIEELSKPGAVVVEKENIPSRYPGTVKVKFAKEPEDGEKWKKFIRDGYLRCFEHVYATLREDSFGHHFVKAIRHLKQNKNRTSFLQNNEISYYGRNKRLEVIYCRTKPAEHIAIIQNALVKYPNIYLEFVFDGQAVTADVCPAIRYKDIKQCFDPELCCSGTLATEVMNKGSILLVGRENLLFRVTYTETELDYIKNKMKRGHKLLYIYLKVIVHGFRWEALPSYALKTICINHDLTCRNENNLLKCFDDIIEFLRVSIVSESLKNVFNQKVDLFMWNYDLERYVRRFTMLPVFTEINNICHKPIESTAAGHLEEVREIVKQADERFDPSETNYVDALRFAT